MPFTTLDRVDEADYTRARIAYSDGEGAEISAYLLTPHRPGLIAAVVIHHQHNGERHLGKSEVCGLAGDPLQAFGPALAKRGLIVLARDSICFEDRRTGQSGILPAPGEADWLQHYNQMAYRLLRGDSLMRKVLDDARIAVSLLTGLPAVDRQNNRRLDRGPGQSLDRAG